MTDQGLQERVEQARQQMKDATALLADWAEVDEEWISPADVEHQRATVFDAFDSLTGFLTAALRVVEAARAHRQAELATEHKPHVTEDDRRGTVTTAWVYTLDGAAYSEDEHSRRLNALEDAAVALDAVLAEWDALVAEKETP